jgi:glycosyltransferase involved in cell wall biosynthesis
MQVVALSWRDTANPLAGGAELVLDCILTGLEDRGFDVALICGGPVAEHSYPVVRAGGTYSQYLLAPLACMTRFRRADVVIDVENGVPYFAPLWRRRPKLCLVHHVHTDQWATRFPNAVAAALQWLESRVMPRVYRRCRFVAVSESTSIALQAIGVKAEQICVIEHGTPAPLPGTQPKAASPTFLCLSRLVPHKRVDVVLEAWRSVVNQLPGRLLIAGDGPELEAIRRQARDIAGVEVVGRVSEEEKYRLLREAWALVCASHHEGWGMTILEAASVGTPSLAIAAPGVRDAVIDGVTGVLVPGQPDGHLPAALAHAWVEFASDEHALTAMGEAARKRAEGMDWATAVDRWASLVSDVAAGRRTDKGEHPGRTTASIPGSTRAGNEG